VSAAIRKHVMQGRGPEVYSEARRPERARKNRGGKAKRTQNVSKIFSTGQESSILSVRRAGESNLYRGFEIEKRGG